MIGPARRVAPPVDFGCRSQHLGESTGVQPASAVTTFLFTDIEGSTRLWEQQPEPMRLALAHHDAIARAAVEAHRGVVVKTTGDGVHAAFEIPSTQLGPQCNCN